jgi:hypothetical protein
VTHLHLVDGEWVPYDTITHLHTMDCTTGEELGETRELLQVLARGYPRVTAGRIVTLESNIHSKELLLEGEALTAGQSLVVWSPTTEDTHDVVVEGLDSLETEDIDGGRLIYANATQSGRYTFRVLQTGQ